MIKLIINLCGSLQISFHSQKHNCYPYKKTRKVGVPRGANCLVSPHTHSTSAYIVMISIFSLLALCPVHTQAEAGMACRCRKPNQTEPNTSSSTDIKHKPVQLVAVRSRLVVARRATTSTPAIRQWIRGVWKVRKESVAWRFWGM